MVPTLASAGVASTLLPDPQPRPLVAPVISVDDHLIEPPDLFEGRMPRGLADRAPTVHEDPGGTQSWRFEGRAYPNVGLNAVVGRPREEWSMEPARFDEMRPGCFDIEARVADMDIAGIWASLCFPSLVAGFCGAVFSSADDPELGLACTRAWNRWHLEVWAGAHPERIIPLQLPWLADPDLAAAEVRSNAEAGFKAVSFPEFPAPARPPLHLHHPLGPVLRGLPGDRHRGLSAHRGVVVGPAPLPRPSLRAAADRVSGECPPGRSRVGVVRCGCALPRTGRGAVRRGASAGCPC